ncbi:MAG: hypothetical protein ACKPKO_39420, partial [Candidatus Fonsibacter sp.]
GFLDVADVGEGLHGDYRGNVIDIFYKTTLSKATCEDEAEEPGPGRPPLGGALHDPASANCASMAARRLHNIANLAGWQIRDDGLRWTREMTRHLEQLERHPPQRLAADTLHRIRRVPAAH